MSQLKRLCQCPSSLPEGELQDGKQRQSETSIDNSVKPLTSKYIFNVKVSSVPCVEKVAKVKKLAQTRPSIQGESTTPVTGGYNFGTLKTLMGKLQEVNLVKAFHEDLVGRDEKISL